MKIGSEMDPDRSGTTRGKYLSGISHGARKRICSMCVCDRDGTTAGGAEYSASVCGLVFSDGAIVEHVPTPRSEACDTCIDGQGGGGVRRGGAERGRSEQPRMGMETEGRVRKRRVAGKDGRKGTMRRCICVA